jgi:AcrR family transcriptional regulator
VRDAAGLWMGRPREFNETAALEAALECFWQRGYKATSMRELAASMGLTAPSLYNAFGDKQALYALALERYLDRTTRDRLRRYETSLPPKQAIHQFFGEIIDRSVNDRDRKGCFLVNCVRSMSRRIKASLAPGLPSNLPRLKHFSEDTFSPRNPIERRRAESMPTMLHA